MSRGEYRPIHTVLVDSPEFHDLSADARLLFFTVKLSMGPSGIDVLYADQLRHRSGLEQDRFREAVQELEDGDWIRRDGVVWWLRNGLRYEPRLSPKNEKHVTGVRNHAKGLPKVGLVNDFARYYSEWFGGGIPFPDIENNGSGKAIEGLSEGSRSTDTETERETDTETYTETETDGGLGRLLEYLPDGSAVENSVRSVASTVRNERTWAMALMGLYGPNGTEEKLMSEVSEAERPEVLAVALQRLAAEGEDYRGNFFRGIVRGVIRDRTKPDGPNFGDESARDADRIASYRQRETARSREEWEKQDAESDAEMAALWSWWDDVDLETKQAIKEEARKKCEKVPEPMHRAILVGVIEEHRKQEAANA